MPLAPGTRLGPYEVGAPLGAGGMGEVYRARDTRLGRDVAIKVLPQHLPVDANLRARFEREARTVSTLNHPHICTLYDVGREGDTDFLVMELIEGETLAHRLQRGALSTTEVLRIGSQIADALDRAHRAGVVHRDLKPGNVMLTRTGAKLMDFGLAREKDGHQPGMPGLTITRSEPLTAEGTIVGTFQYMAPEQLEGREADARSDLWALGCVIYEMATGKRAFEGKSQASLISAIMSSDPPPIEQVSPLSPPALDRLVHACLAKDPEDRLQTAHDVKLQLSWIAGDSQISKVGKPGARAGRLRREWLAWGVAGLAVLVAAVALWRPRPADERRIMRFSVAPPDGVSMFVNSASLAISPDGKLLVYTAFDTSGTLRLWLRPLDSLDSRMLVGTESSAPLPFWSSDSRSIAFFADGKLKRVSVASGKIETICDAPDGRGGTWNQDGVILFAPIATGPLMRVSADGGETVEIMTPDTARHEAALRFPEFLPDGRHYLFDALPAKRGAYDIFVGTLGSKERKLLLTAASRPVYADPGMLVFARGDRLWAQRFDARALKMVGDAIPAGPAPPLIGASGAPTVSISRTGVLTRSSATPPIVRFTWLDRSGKETGPFPLALGPYGSFRFSPDGKRAVIEKNTGPNSSDLWIVDMERALATRLTSQPTSSVLNATWSPDGKQIAFACDVTGPYDIYRKRADGEGSEELLYHSDVPLKNISQWSPDGRFILFDMPNPATGWDIWMLPVEGDHRPVPLVRGRFNETAGQISPDGRWLAFTSDESGRTEVYVQSYPTPGNRIQVSTNGALFGGWSADGKEFAMATPDGAVTVADAQSSPTLKIGRPRPLFRPRPDLISFSPTPDLRKFLMSTAVGPTTTLTTVCEINWAEGLSRH